MFSTNSRPPKVLDRSLTTFFNQVPRDLRPGNPDRDFWQSWSSTINLYAFRCTSEEHQHDQCWGWTIVRASYDNDDHFNKAVATIQRLALVRLEIEYRDSRFRGAVNNESLDAFKDRLFKLESPVPSPAWVSRAWESMIKHARNSGLLSVKEPLTPDLVITHELAHRFHNNIVQDRQALDGADVSKAWSYAHALTLEERELGARGYLFIYLDRDSINHLAQAPTQDELSKMTPLERRKIAWDMRVKVVSTASEVNEDGDDTDEMMQYPLARRLLRLYDLFETFLHLCHGNLDEISIEGRDREHFDRERVALTENMREWELCGDDFPDTVTNSWLRDLYGERVRRT